MRRRELAAMGFLGPVIQGPPVETITVPLWKADYDTAGLTSAGTNGAWPHEQPPKAPGLILRSKNLSGMRPGLVIHWDLWA